MSHHIVGYLIGLAVGYWVLTHAEKQKNLTKTVGKVIAWVIIAVSLIGPLCIAASCGMKCHNGMSYGAHCPMDKDGHGMMDNK